MPCGIRRSSTIASASIAISPITGVEPNETTWLIAPKITELASVPEMIAAPPAITVMNDLAMYSDPDDGSRPVSGAMTPPARPESAAPAVKVHM